MNKEYKPEDRRTVVLELADRVLSYDPEVDNVHDVWEELEDLRERRRITPNRYKEAIDALIDARQLKIASDPAYFEKEEALAAHLGNAIETTPEEERLYRLNDLSTRFIAIGKMIEEQQGQYQEAAKDIEKIRRPAA